MSCVVKGGEGEGGGGVSLERVRECVCCGRGRETWREGESGDQGERPPREGFERRSERRYAEQKEQIVLKDERVVQVHTKTF